MQATHCRRSGFSFMEMTITVLVMGILAAVAAPSYHASITRYRVELAAKRIVADLHYARSEAQRTSANRAVQFDTSNNRYTLSDVTDLDNSANNYIVELVDDPFSSVLVSASFGGDDEDEEVVFDMYGRPDDFGAVVVQSGSIQKTINLATDGTASSP